MQVMIGPLLTVLEKKEYFPKTFSIKCNSLLKDGKL